MATGPRSSPSMGDVTPLWATLTFTFLNSIGTGVVAAGIYFLAKHAYGFGVRENFGLALLFGATYIPSALLVGPALRRLTRSTGIGYRTVLAAMMVLLAAFCILPSVVGRGEDGSGSWSVWVLVGVSGPLNGALWPVTEAYLSGGRAGRALRSATGRFNVVWASALVLAFWGMAPVLEAYPLWVLACQGVLHLACIPLLRWFRENPAAPREDVEHHDTALNRRLLTTFRLQLPASFLVISAAEPYLPTLVRQLELPVVWETPAAATWLVARVGAFVLLERWHGWHGRWSTPVVAAVLMVGGFVLMVLGPVFGRLGGGSGLAIATSMVGLGGIGLGVGAIYAGGFYYAMEVGQAEVDAGGKHEALIGLGYSAGPICGLLAIWVSSERSFEGLFIASVGAVAVAMCGLAVWRAFRTKEP